VECDRMPPLRKGVAKALGEHCFDLGKVS